MWIVDCRMNVFVTKFNIISYFFTPMTEWIVDWMLAKIIWK